ncbi:hypothetical protein Tco_1244087 [Tanacetum coccineum]
MTTLQFADTHNLVAFLAKPAESEGFEQIIDFLNAHTIKYALTVNPTIYTSCIEQFLATVKVKTVNGEQQLQALVDGKNIIITEATVRRDLQLEDANGVDCLPNATIFEQLTLMGTMASAIICLATNQKFNFSKYIFESMVKNLDNAIKLLMYPRRETRLFPTIVVQAQEETSEGSAMPTNPQHTPIITQPSSSHPQRKQKSRRPKRKDIEIPQSSVPSDPTNVADKAVNEEPKKKGGSRTHKLKRLYKVGRSARVVSSDEASLGDQEDATKQGRKIDDIDADEDITLENVHDAEMFDVNDLHGDEVFVEKEVHVEEVIVLRRNS